MRLSWMRVMFVICLLVGLAGSATGPGWGQSPSSASGRPALYDFGMGMCFSCKEMEKILEEIKNQYGNQMEVRLLYVDREKELFKQYRIMAVPTQVFLDASGKEVDRHMGLFPQKELVKKLKELKFIKE